MVTLRIGFFPWDPLRIGCFRDSRAGRFLCVCGIYGVFDDFTGSVADVSDLISVGSMEYQVIIGSGCPVKLQLNFETTTFTRQCTFPLYVKIHDYKRIIITITALIFVP